MKVIGLKWSTRVPDKFPIFVLPAGFYDFATEEYIQVKIQTRWCSNVSNDLADIVIFRLKNTKFSLY